MTVQKKFDKLDIEICEVYSSQSFEVKFLNRVVTDLENLEMSGNLKRLLKVREFVQKSENLRQKSKSQGQSGNFCLKLIFSQVEDPNFENFLREHAPRPP